MTEAKVKLITGSLLHDIGKVIYRQGIDRRNHSLSVYIRYFLLHGDELSAYLFRSRNNSGCYGIL